MALSDLTPGEKAYLESGGEDATALLAENPSVASGETVAEPVVPIAAAADPVIPAAAAVAADPTEPGEEEIAAPDGKSKRRVVDSRALKAEREKRQAVETELKQYRENYTRVDERLRMLSAAIEQPDPVSAATASAEAPIDPEQDIFGAYKQLMKKVEKLEAGHNEVVTQSAEERQTAALVSTYRQDSATFRQQTPDFMDGYNFLLGKREAQLRALGYSDDEIRTTLYTEEMNLASRALAMRQSPSQQIYALAQSMGYTKAAAVPVPAVPAAAAASPAVQAAAVPAAAAPSVTAEIDRIKAGQAASRSLSSGGGAAGEELSLETLANMPQKDFEKFMNVPGNREKVEIAMGRRAA